jgi:hypothetical protein
MRMIINVHLTPDGVNRRGELGHARYPPKSQSAGQSTGTVSLSKGLKKHAANLDNLAKITVFFPSELLNHSTRYSILNFIGHKIL